MTGITRSASIGLAAIALVTGTLWVANSSEAPAASATLTDVGTQASDFVTRRTLEHTETFAGSLGYGESFGLPGQVSGTVTWVPPEGAVLHPGDLLYRIDERPTYWARGDLPMYRSLAAGSEGADVEQLQRFLQDEGYLDNDSVIDGKFGAGTRKAVVAWQEDRDLEKTGRIDAAQLLILPYQALRVAESPRIGEPAGDGVLDVTTSDLFVSLEVGARKKKVFEGTPTIEVMTADGTRYQATVESIVAQQSQDSVGGQQYLIRLQLDSEAELEPGDVTVSAIDTLAEDVLTVPTRALVALVEGGYAVEVVAPDGSTDYRTVDIGEFADGWVEVSGDIAENDEVVVPE